MVHVRFGHGARAHGGSKRRRARAACDEPTPQRTCLGVSPATEKRDRLSFAQRAIRDWSESMRPSRFR
jgi:hypothetical protein